MQVAQERFDAILAGAVSRDDPALWRALAQACHHTHEDAWGLRATEAALRARPADARLKSARMWALFRAGEVQRGVALARTILDGDPENHGAWEGLGEGLTMQGAWAEADAALARACHSDRACAEAQRARGHLALCTNKLKEALAACEAAIRILPNFVDAWIQKGIVYQRLGMPDEALAAYAHAIGIDPSNASAYINRGGLLAGVRGDLDDALADLNKACSLAPDEVTARINRALVLQRMDRPEEAEAAFARACELEPWRAPIQVSRWNLMRRLGHGEALGALLEALAEGHADDPRFLHVRGHAYEEMGRLSESARCFAAARAEGRRGRRVSLDHAYTLIEAGRPTDALTVIEPASQRFSALPGPHAGPGRTRPGAHGRRARRRARSRLRRPARGCALRARRRPTAATRATLVCRAGRSYP